MAELLAALLGTPRPCRRSLDDVLKEKYGTYPEDSPMRIWIKAVLTKDVAKVVQLATADKGLVNSPFGSKKIDKQGKPALWHAYQRGFYQMVRDLLRLGANPNFMINHKKLDIPFLFAVVRSRNLSVTQMLLEAGADIHVKSPKGETVLSDLLLHTPQDKNDPLPIFRMIVEFGEKIGKPFDLSQPINNRFLLHDAVLWRFRSIVYYLIEHKKVAFNQPQSETDGRTVFHCAVNAEDIDVIQMLAIAGVDPDAKDEDGRTAACMTNNPHIQRKLADINFFNSHRLNPMAALHPVEAPPPTYMYPILPAQSANDDPKTEQETPDVVSSDLVD